MWIITFVSVWLGFTWGVFRIFKEFGEAAPDKTKQELANWMLNINKMETPPLHLYFIYLFDYIYTLRHLSWKCFYRSTITSILIYSSSLASLVIFSLLLNDDLFMLSFIDSDYVEFALIYVIVFLVLNLVPDYFSLLQTRYTLKLLKNSKRIKRWVLVLVMDLVFSMLIFILLLAYPSYEIYELIEYWRTFMGGEKKSFVEFYTSELEHNVLPILIPSIISSFFTSIWLWLFVLAGIVSKCLSFSKLGFRLLTQHLNVKQKPFRSLGIILTIIMTIVYSVIIVISIFI